MFRKRNQIISVLLIGLLAVLSFPVEAFATWSAPSSTDWEPLSRTNVKARFAVGSDVHVPDYDSEEKLENALNTFYSIDPDTDAVIFAGDLTESGAASQYDSLMSVADQSELSSKIIWGMGNHEYYGYSKKQSAIDKFTEKTGQEPDKVITRGGITIITLGTHSEDGGDYSEQYDFLKNALENAASEDATAPIFVIAHHGVKDSAYTTNEWYGNYGEGTDQDMVALMAQYPQVIHISGHSHATMENPASIDQSKGFTCIQDGTISSYFENETGKIDSNGAHKSVPEYTDEASQALVIDVGNDNKVTIRRLNLTTGKYIYEKNSSERSWVIDTPALVANASNPPFTYTSSRASGSSQPVFGDGSAVTVKKVDSSSVAFTFDQASAADNLSSIVLGDLNDNMVHSYKMKVTNTETGEAVPDSGFNRDYFLRFADYYRKNQAASLAGKINGLSPKTKYKLEVSALTAYGVESSNSVSTTFTTAAEKSKASAEYITQKPVLDGELTDSIWSVKDALTNDMFNNAEHNAVFDVKYDFTNLYLAVKVRGDKELAAGTAWNKGDIVWLYIDPTLHASSPYTDGDWQIGIGFNPDDATKPYIVMGGGVTASSEEKDSLTQGINGAVKAADDGWNAEIAIPWNKLGIKAKEKYELGFDLSVDNYQSGKDLESIDWSGSNWNDTTGFGKLTLSNDYILDVDFSDGTANDDSPVAHTPEVKGNPVISESSDLKKKIASFDGDDDAYAYNLTAVDFENLKNSFTMECMMKLKSFVNGDPFMDCDGSGLGFELNGDGHTMEFWAHINGSYKVPAADISEIKNDWVHATATYDGSALKLYINGVLKDSQDVTGTLDIPKDSAKWVMIGSDTSGDGGVQLPIACDISNARLYGKALSAEEIAALYKADTTVSGGNSDEPGGSDDSGGSGGSSHHHSHSSGSPAQTEDQPPSPPSTEQPANNSESSEFKDVSNHWAKEAIEYAANKGILQGTGNGKFDPDASMTRGMIVTVLWRIGGSPAVGGNQVFPDVAANAWYGSAVSWAAANGIVTGEGNGFAPNGDLTREQLAVILYNYARNAGIETTASGSISGYSDGSSVSSWAVDAMNWAVGSGLITGGTDGSLSPQSTSTRAQVATILMRFDEKINH